MNVIINNRKYTVVSMVVVTDYKTYTLRENETGDIAILQIELEF